MSGYKYIQITETQWNDVQSRLTTAKRENDETKRKLEEEKRRSQERIQSLTQSSQREIASLNARLAQQLQQQEARLHQEMENRLNQQRQSLNQEMGCRLEQQQEAIKQDFERRLARQSEALISQFHQEINEVQQSLGQAIAGIQTEMQRQNRSKTEIAEFWLREYQTLLDGIKRERIHHDHFKPGQLASFEMQIENAMGILSSDPSAATGIIASQFANLTQFRNELIIYENEYTSLLNSAQETALSLLGTIQADMDASYSLDGETVKANMDYWTDGKFSDELQRLEDIRIRLQHSDVLSLVELQEINRVLLEIQSTIPELEEQARLRFSACEARVRTMEDVADALAEHGWQLDNSIYVNGDEKGDIRSHFINLTEEDEIVVTIGDTRVEIDQFITSTKNEDITSANGRVIGECLENIGLCADGIAHPTTEQGYERRLNGRREVLSPFKRNDE